MTDRAKISFLYTVFASVATAVNIGAQDLTLRVFSGRFFSLYVAMAIGTAAGLVVKYILDHHWIFHCRASGVSIHGKLFVLYTITGLFTTFLFWATELAFNAITPDGRYRQLGALLGLAAGYAIKYRLDKKFVFTEGRV